MAIAGEFGLDLTPEGTAALSMLDELEDIVVEGGVLTASGVEPQYR